MHAVVLGVLEEVPVSEPLSFHSSHSPSSPPMKSSFLPGCAHMYAYSARRFANFCQRSPGILSSSEPLPCTTSSCESGSTKFSLNAYMSENVSVWWWKRR